VPSGVLTFTDCSHLSTFKASLRYGLFSWLIAGTVKQQRRKASRVCFMVALVKAEI